MQHTANKAPIGEAYAALHFFLSQSLGGTASEYADTLVSASRTAQYDGHKEALAFKCPDRNDGASKIAQYESLKKKRASEWADRMVTASKIAQYHSLKKTLDELSEQACAIERAVTAFIKTTLPELPNLTPNKIEFFSKVSTSMADCPLHMVTKTVGGLKELCPNGSEIEALLPKQSQEEIRQELALDEAIEGFLARYEWLLECLLNDSLDDFDYRKELREELTQLSAGPVKEQAELNDPQTFENVGSINISGERVGLAFDEAAVERYEQSLERAKGDGGAAGAGQALRLIWAALPENYIERFPSPHHFAGYLESQELDFVYLPMNFLKIMKGRETPLVS